MGHGVDDFLKLLFTLNTLLLVYIFMLHPPVAHPVNASLINKTKSVVSGWCCTHVFGVDFFTTRYVL